MGVLRCYQEDEGSPADLKCDFKQLSMLLSRNEALRMSSVVGVFVLAQRPMEAEARFLGPENSHSANPAGLYTFNSHIECEIYERDI